MHAARNPRSNTTLLGSTTGASAKSSSCPWSFTSARSRCSCARVRVARSEFDEFAPRQAALRARVGVDVAGAVVRGVRPHQREQRLLAARRLRLHRRPLHPAPRVLRALDDARERRLLLRTEHCLQDIELRRERLHARVVATLSTLQRRAQHREAAPIPQRTEHVEHRRPQRPRAPREPTTQELHHARGDARVVGVHPREELEALQHVLR
ncbi:MAG: hypothetical protein IPJ34_43230 [Myxococcales bacterium]|nr:hypothetical protein [Myxococcales bacterium]